MLPDPKLPANDHSPVRVCFVIDRLARSGTETQLLMLIRELDRQKVRPYLCLLDGMDSATEQHLPSDCPTIRLGVRRLRSMRAIRRAHTFWRFLRRERIDVVQTYFPDSTRFAAPIAKAAGVRVFGSRRNIGHWMNRTDARIAKLYNRLFIDKIIANCGAARETAIQQEGADPENVLVVPNHIDLDRFTCIPTWTPSQQKSVINIGMVGNLRPVKGVDIFIHAAKLVLETVQNARFHVAGQGNVEHYQALIEDHGLSQFVTLLGEVTDVPGLLAKLDIAVLPSRAEGLSNALLEYMAAGRPIVATAVGGTPEFIINSETGILVEPNDALGTARAIIRLCRDEDQSAFMASTARKQVRDLFDSGSETRRYERLYQGTVVSNNERSHSPKSFDKRHVGAS